VPLEKFGIWVKK